MPQPKFQLYKHIKISGKWRYCRAEIYSNGKVKPHVVVVGGQEEKHEEGSYCIRHKNSKDQYPRRRRHTSGRSSSWPDRAAAGAALRPPR
jgi:hypothetical protein